MLKMLSGLTNAEMGVYILWGVAFLGLVLKLISNSYVKSMMRSTENMATTRKKNLRTLRQKYENRRNLGMEGASGDFVEKNIRRWKFLGIPIEAIGRRFNLGVLSTIMITAGAFLFYDNKWRGSPEMVTFLANAVIVCAFLMSLENIFLTRNKVEIMKANIRDYLDNMTERKMPVRAKPLAVSGRMTDNNIIGDDLVLSNNMQQSSTEEENPARARASDHTAVKAESAATEHSQDDALNSFLKEFFS